LNQDIQPLFSAFSFQPSAFYAAFRYQLNLLTAYK